MKTIEQENEDLRAQVAALQRDTQTLTCVYCGQEYPPGTPTHGAPVLTAHILVCEKHPMRKLRKALAQLVGVDGREDLEKLEMAIRVMPAPEEDKVHTIDAIHALRDTLAPTPPAGQ